MQSWLTVSDVDAVPASRNLFFRLFPTNTPLLAWDQILLGRGKAMVGSAAGSMSGRNIMTLFGLQSQVST